MDAVTSDIRCDVISKHLKHNFIFCIINITNKNWAEGRLQGENRQHMGLLSRTREINQVEDWFSLALEMQDQGGESVQHAGRFWCRSMEVGIGGVMVIGVQVR